MRVDSGFDLYFAATWRLSGGYLVEPATGSFSGRCSFGSYFAGASLFAVAGSTSHLARPTKLEPHAR